MAQDDGLKENKMNEYRHGWEAAKTGAMRMSYRGESDEFWRGFNDARTDQPYRPVPDGTLLVGDHDAHFVPTEREVP